MRKDWTYKKLGEVATFSRGLTFAKGDVADSSSKIVLRSNNIDLSSHSLIFDDVACLNEDFVIPDEKKLHKGDIFICMSNGSTQHLGKVAFIEDDLDYAFGGFMGAIHPDVKEVYPKYAFYSCRSTEYRKFLTSIVNGININNLKWSELSNFPIPIPPLATQSRIVSELDLLQSIIDKQKAQLKELDNLAQAIFYDMFGDPVENEKGWEVKKIEEICSSIVRGPFGSALKKEFFVKPDETTYKVYEQKHAIQKNASIGDYYISEERFRTLKRFEVSSGDIIMSCSGTIGEFFEIPIDAEKGLMNQALLKFTLNQRIDKSYFLFTMEFVKNSFEKKGSGLQNIGSVGTVKSTLISLPSLPLQQSFAQKIESIERQKELINQSIREAQTLFDSRMEYYFGE